MPTTSRPTVTTRTVTPVILDRREMPSHHWLSCSCIVHDDARRHVYAFAAFSM